MEKLTSSGFYCEHYNPNIDGCIACGQPKKCQECLIRRRYDRLARLEKEIEYGHLVEKVFNVGDTVYSAAPLHGDGCVIKDTVKEVVVIDGETRYLLTNEQSTVFLSRIFATEEQAQIRLKDFQKQRIE